LIIYNKQLILQFLPVSISSATKEKCGGGGGRGSGCGCGTQGMWHRLARLPLSFFRHFRALN